MASVVRPGWVGPDAFLAGYGAAQAVPGPLFTFAAFLGTSMEQPPSGVAGATRSRISCKRWRGRSTCRRCSPRSPR